MSGRLHAGTPQGGPTRGAERGRGFGQGSRNRAVGVDRLLDRGIGTVAVPETGSWSVAAHSRRCADVRQLSGLDASFLYMESGRVYGHVSGLGIFARPDVPDWS